MNVNDLQVKVYDGPTSTTEVSDATGALATARVDSFGTCFPGGLYTTARIRLAQRIDRARAVHENMRVAIYNGLALVWEGVTSEIGLNVNGDQQWLDVACVGQWGPQIRSRTINKAWADNRLSADVWIQQPQGDKDNQVNIDRMNRISIGPQAVAWSAGEIVAAFRYTMPTGQTIKRIVATLQNRESGQNWTTRIHDVIGGSTLASESGDGVSTATDTTLATPRQYVEFQFVSNANQTPTNAYGRMRSVMVYSETGNINPTEIVKDIRALLTGLNSDESLIGSNTFALEPFVTNGQESIETVLQRVAGFGDASFNPWAVQLLASTRATTPDGKPVLSFSAYPSLTDYDYVVTLAELEGSVEVKRAVDGAVYNWIAVRYRDELNNRQVVITPDDYATLKDTTSIALWGQRELIVDCDTGSATTALNFGRRVLGWRKDAKYKVTAPLRIRGTIRSKIGQRIPVCRVASGARVKIENFLADEVGVTDAGLTFVITATTYRPDTETLEMSTGVPDNLAVYLARLALVNNRVVA